MASGFSEAITLNITNKNPAREEVVFVRPLRSIRVTFVPCQVTVYAGYGTGSPIATIERGSDRDISFPYPTDTVTFSWPLGSTGKIIFFAQENQSIPIVNPGGIPLSVFDSTDPRDPAEGPYRSERWSSLAKSPILTSGVGVVSQIVPTTLQDGDSVLHAPGDPITPTTEFEYYDPRVLPTLNTFAIHARRSARPYNSAAVFAAAGRVTLLSMMPTTPFVSYSINGYKLILTDCQVAMMSTTAAADIYAELVRIDADPGGGIVVTPNAIGGPDIDAIPYTLIRRLPNAVAEVGEPISAVYWSQGITGAVPVSNPPQANTWEQLVPRGGPSIESPPMGIFRTPGNDYGLAVVIDCSVAATVRFHIKLTFTEELY